MHSRLIHPKYFHCFHCTCFPLHVRILNCVFSAVVLHIPRICGKPITLGCDVTIIWSSVRWMFEVLYAVGFWMERANAYNSYNIIPILMIGIKYTKIMHIYYVSALAPPQSDELKHEYGYHRLRWLRCSTSPCAVHSLCSQLFCNIKSGMYAQKYPWAFCYFCMREKFQIFLIHKF